MRQKKQTAKSTPAAKPAARPSADKSKARPAVKKAKPLIGAAEAKKIATVVARFAGTKRAKAALAAAKSAQRAKRADPEAPPLATKKKLAIKTKGRAIRRAKFSVGQVVRHRIYPFRGVVFDIDPVFANTDEWLAAIPAEVRPRKNQPFYHLLAESAETEYIAYVSEQNLLPDETGAPLRHPQINEYFVEEDDGTLRAVFLQAH